MKKLLFPLLVLSTLATPARDQTGTTQNQNRIDGYGAPVSPSVPVSRAADETTIDIIGGYYSKPAATARWKVAAAPSSSPTCPRPSS